MVEKKEEDNQQEEIKEPDSENIENEEDNNETQENTDTEEIKEDENIEEIDAKNVQFALAIYRNKKDENNNQYPRFEYIQLSNNKKDAKPKLCNKKSAMLLP